MGTRGLTIVKYQGQIMVAQYGQWDHYPTGQGKTIQKFLKNNYKGENKKIFKKHLLESNFVTMHEAESDINSVVFDRNQTSEEESDSFNFVFPQYSRDTGAEILELILNGPVPLQNSLDFKNDTLFCDYHYTLDLDTEMISIGGHAKYKGSFSDFKKLDLEKFEGRE